MPRPPLPPRPTMPAIVGDLVADRRAASALLASMAALLAAGLDPKVLAPMATTTQALVRARPDLEGLLMLVSLGTALAVLGGGAIGDTARARPLVIGGLAVSLACAVAALLLQGGAFLYTAARFGGILSAAVVMPVSLAVAAVSYTGITRATAIGVAYAAYGLGQGISPFLVSVIPGNPTPAFLAAIAATSLALWVVRARLPDLPRPTLAERPVILATALWAGGVVLVATAVLWFGTPWTDPLRVAMGAAGLAVIGLFLVLERRWREARPAELRIDRRPVTIALFVGLAIAMAQVVPMTQLPNTFGVALSYGTVMGVVALAPLFAGLVLAGPVAGWLLARFQPRSLVFGGMIAVGLGDVAMAAVLTPATPYLVFVLPLALVGAGFVVATTVRTAIIFAAVPRGLPATAAALNEASIEVGSRAGLVVITAVLAEIAVAAYAASLVGTPAEIEAAVAPFREVLAALGLPSFAAVAGAVPSEDLAAYRDAYLAGVRVALLGAGAIALGGGVLAWATLGRRNPLQTVYEHREDR